jgi:hypothetical protein
MAPELSVKSSGTPIIGTRFRQKFPRVARMLTVGLLSQAAALLAVPALAQSPVIVPPAGTNPVALPANMAPVPFGVGERMDYDVKFSSIKVGTGSIEVREIADVRGQPSWHTVFNVQGRALIWFSVKIMLESWFDVTTLASRRFHEDTKYTGYQKNLTTEIFPERGMFKEGEGDERVTVEKPLDNGSFFYFVRTIPLEVGQTYTLSQYYKPEANPVVIHVARRERITVPAGTFNTIVLQPKIKTKGLFSEDGKAEVWLTDDSTRMMVQMKSDLAIGSINMYLSKFKAGAAPKP